MLQGFFYIFYLPQRGLGTVRIIGCTSSYKLVFTVHVTNITATEFSMVNGPIFGADDERKKFYESTGFILRVSERSWYCIK